MSDGDSERSLSSSRLADFLRTRDRQIIDVWLDRARKLSAAQRLSSLALEDHLPAVLTNIAEKMDAADPGERGSQDQAPKTHALERLGRGYDLEEIIQEYMLLRRCIVDLWAGENIAAGKVSDLSDLSDAIDASIAEAAARYWAQRERVLRTLDRISEAAFSASDLDNFFTHMLGATLEAMEAVDTLVFLLRDRDELRVHAFAGLNRDVQRFSVQMGAGFAGRVAADAHARFSRHAAEDPDVESGALREEGVRALYGVPLTYGGKVIGVAHMGSKTAYEFSEDDKLLFESVIGRATLVVQNALLAMRDHASSAAARAFGRAGNFDDAVAMLLRELGGTLHWDVGTFWRVDAEGAVLRYDRFWHSPSVDAAEFDAACRNLTLPTGAGLPGRAWQARAPVYIADFAAIVEFPRRAAAAAADLRTALAFPIRVGDEVLGVIELLSKSLRWSSDEGVHVAGAVAEQIDQFTRRIAAQEALQRSSAMNAAILDAALDCVLSIDADSRILSWNAAAEQTFGYSRSEAIGQDMAELIVPPRLRADHRNGLARYLATGRQQYLDRRIETGAVRSDGTEFPVELTITQVQGEDPPIFTGFVRDIQEEKEGERERARLLNEVRRTEHAQRFLSDSSKQLAESLDYEATLAKVARLAVPRIADWCIVDVMEKGKLRRVSAAHVDPRKESAASTLARLYPADPEAPRGAAQVLRTGRTEVAAEISERLLAEIARDEQHLRILLQLGLESYLSTPITVRGRTLGAITLVSSDPERRYGEHDVRLAEELALRAATAIDNARLYADARAAVRTREDVLAIVSHDLRNPLGTISLSAKVLSMDSPAASDAIKTKRRQQQIDVINRATERMEHMIGDLLDMASIQGGRLSIELRPTDLVPLLREVFEAHEPLAREAGLALHEDFAAARVKVLCDRNRIVQALSNLLGNAIKFCSPGDSVTLRADRRVEDVEIALTDTGSGISAEHLEQIFEPYRTLEREGQRGTGLGLYITKGIVEAHGGAIRVESTLGAGTTFLFTVPLAP